MKTNFSTQVNEVTSPSDMKLSDMLMDPASYVYEGNWAFCRFDHPHLLGARIGFGTGSDFGEDRGWAVSEHSAQERIALFRIEILTDQGSYLYSHAGKEEELVLDDHVPSHVMSAEGREILNVQGFPAIRWKSQSDDGTIRVDVLIEPYVFVTLPDNIQKNTAFSMWLAPCSIKGTVTIDGKSTVINGTAFVDHPRLSKVDNQPKEFGSYLYTPVILDDGTCFFAYYTDFIDGERCEAYSFGYLVDKNRNVTAYRGVSMKNLWFTPECQVERADLVFANENSEIHLSIREEYLPIKRSWGNSNVSPTKKGYILYPQLFTADFLQKDASSESRQSGRGLLEYVKNDKRTYNIR